MTFRDRTDAGRQLALAVQRLGLERPFVLGLTRGGVPVALEVARALKADLDVLVVRKIGAPGFPEYAAGALAEGGIVWVNPEAVGALGATEEEIARLADAERLEVGRRVRAFRGDRPAPDLSGRAVVVVDDGVATGSTAHAAARAARALGAARVVLAAPVIAAQSAPELREEYDEVVALDYPEPFVAVGLWYERFQQLTDGDVVECLRRARGEPADRGPGEVWDGEWIGPNPDDPGPPGARRGEPT